MPGPPYGADLGDVRALLPHRRIAEDTSPTEEAVTGYIGWAGARVRARVGDLEPHADTEALELAARGVVAHMAAAMAEDAAYPERASVADTSYGAVLWARAAELLGELLEALGIDGDTGGEVGQVGTGGIASSFPEAMFTRAQGF